MKQDKGLESYVSLHLTFADDKLILAQSGTGVGLYLSSGLTYLYS